MPQEVTAESVVGKIVVGKEDKGSGCYDEISLLAILAVCLIACLFRQRNPYLGYLVWFLVQYHHITIYNNTFI